MSMSMSSDGSLDSYRSFTVEVVEEEDLPTRRMPPSSISPNPNVAVEEEEVEDMAEDEAEAEGAVVMQKIPKEKQRTNHRKKKLISLMKRESKNPQRNSPRSSSRPRHS